MAQLSIKLCFSLYFGKSFFKWLTLLCITKSQSYSKISLVRKYMLLEKCINVKTPHLYSTQKSCQVPESHFSMG